MLCLGKLWVGGLFVGLLTVHVITVFMFILVFCLRQAARLNVMFVSHSNAKGTIRE